MQQEEKAVLLERDRARDQLLERLQVGWGQTHLTA